RKLVSPVHNRGDLTWDEIARLEPELAPWCADRWLGAWKRLEPLPGTFAATRKLLHEVAEGVVSPARQPANETALRYTRGGFGTPFFEQDGADCQVRVEHGELVRQRENEETREPLPADVDPAAAGALGEFYGFGCSVLEQLRADEADGDPSIAQLWPEHFDIAIELGDESAGRRANFGASPGDEDHPEPYLYVGPWTAEVSGELWNARGFRGAELSYGELLGAENQRETALEFMRARYRALAEA
ncbi:MAG: hypothetical protein ACJ75Z_13270, partial [Solirubrobacterales bacterium]